ncbi:MAG: 50S ribosomal protein L24 [Verrucomicrobiales bacterium]
MLRIKTHVRKGDQVVVISGNHKGATGKILQVFPDKSRVIIERVHMIKRHQKKTQRYPEGGIIEREGTVHISNVKVVEKGADKKKESPKKTKTKTRTKKIKGSQTSIL